MAEDKVKEAEKGADLPVTEGFGKEEPEQELGVETVLVIGTGNPEIDKKMGGGIPPKSLTLIEGQPDAGKSVLAQQMIWGSVQSGFRSTIYTTENSVQSLVRQMDSLSLDILDALLLDQVRIYPLRLMERKQNFKKVLEGLLHKMQGQADRDLVVVDSITPYLSHISVETAISFMEHCKILCDKGTSIVLTVHTYACEEGTMVRMQSMCDAHLRIRIEEMGDKLVKSLEVAKVRGASRNTGNVIAFEVEPRIGMRIIPFSRARA